ncbi:HNH endonuclease [Agrobacterium sp. 22-211-1]
MATCTRCLEAKDDALFPRSKRTNGRVYRGSWCRSCVAAHEKARRRARGALERQTFQCSETTKECRICRIEKLHEQFYSSKRGLAGVSAYCRDCTKHLRKGRYATSTARVRKKYRKSPKWKSQHRIHQFNRNRVLKAHSDGTVTPAFLERLYGEETCTYCRRNTPENSRTADHRIPLSKGGTHSSQNLTMACHACNSAKRDMTDIDFLEKLRDHNLC